MNANTWAMLCYLGGLVGYLGNGLGSIVAPLILWIIKKDELPEVNEHGKEALNFNISIHIYALAIVLFMICTFGVGAIIGIPLLIVLGIFHLVCTIRAAMSANRGEMYRYPLSIRLVS
ncbi:MAG: DUF4870 domain-containing protein [Planctomycetota bacterium]|nr:DUF4870 domain-containing protein [Planctomycetota bacterium]